jgi:enoyl-CoA hydratase/carnithine racemase
VKILYEPDGQVVRITMNRPEVLNALDLEGYALLRGALDRFEADPELRVAILTGAGDRAFSTGSDLKGPSWHPPEHQPMAMTEPPEAQPRTKPVIAAIDGYCMAGGMEIALYCDIRLATRQSSFAMPEPKRNLLSGPAFVHLSRMIPLGEAMRIELVGDPIDADRAYQIGLIQGVYEDRAGLEAAADQMADKILENSPLAVQFLKRIVKEGRDMTVDHQWKFAEMFAFTLGRTEDALEGPKAFAEKRKPEWKMR